MSFVSIGIKTSIPGTAPAATSGAVTFTSIDEENWLQISGDASAGSGSLYLLRWYPDLAEWRVYMEDKPMSVNSATFSGQFSGHYPFPSREESFVLYDPAAAITATASCARTSSPLTSLSVAGSSTLPAGAATAANQTTANTSLATIATQQTDGTQKTQVTNTVPVSGPLTDAQLRASPVPVSATFTPSGTQNVNLTQVSGGAVALGQAANAASLPVALSSTQTGTAGTPSAQVLSVQGVSGGTNLNATTTQGPGSGSAATFWYTRNTDGTNTMPTMDAAARSGYQRVTDGTNTAAVKAASTAAAASDPSLVVTVSPNSKPAGSSFQWRGAATSELLKSGAGVLRRVICGSNVAGTITLYDNTSATGTIIASLTTTTSTPFNSVEINAAFSTGLYAVSTGMSGGSYTIIWD